MISPSIGRVVWFHMTREQQAYLASIDDPRASIAFDEEQPMAAVVTRVWGDRCVNLAVFDHNGAHFAFTSVDLLQDEDVGGGRAYWAEWMPFQKGQAAKVEELEKSLAAAI